jgi:hypothetical protein
MKREFKGRSFTSVPIKEVPTGRALPYDLYIYLALNARMIKLRARGQEIEPALISAYFERGHESFYFVEGIATASDAERSDSTVVPALAVTSVESEPNSPPSSSEAIAIASPASEAVVTEAVGEVDSDFSAGEKNPETAEMRNVEAAHSESELHLEVNTVENIPESILADKGKESDFALEKTGKEELSFNSDAEEPEEEQSFDSEKAEAEAQALVRGLAEKSNSSSQKFKTDINSIEQELSTFSADNEKFVEEVRTIEAGEEEEADGKWNLTLSDDSPKLRGLSKEDKAAAKLAFALGKKLGKLRSELNDNNRASPQNAEELAQQEARREELSTQIKTLEASSAILESLDDKAIQAENLPDELAGKEKLELLTHLEKIVKEITGSDLLNEKDSRAIAKKIKKVKAEDFDVHGENVDQLQNSLARRRQRMIETSLEMEAAEKKVLNDEVAKEVKAAKVAMLAAREMRARREELSELLNKTPQSKKETIANEEKARELQEKIIALENIAAAAEAGEIIPDSELKGFALEHDPEFELKAGEGEAEGLARIQGKLQELKSEVVDAKQNAAEAQRELMAKINGEGPATNLFGSRLDQPKRQRLEKLSRAKSELAQVGNELEAGVDLEEQSLQAVYENAEAAASEAEALEKIDTALAVKRASLKSMLQLAPRTAAGRAEVEAKALAALAEIHELEKLQDEIERGIAVPAESLAPYVAALDKAQFTKKAGETPQSTLQRLGKILGSAAEQLDATDSDSSGAERELRMEVISGDITALKIKTINTKPLLIEEKRLSRHLKEFLETGKTGDPQEIWEIKKSVEAQSRMAQAEINIAKKITEMSATIKSLALEKGGSLEEVAERRVKMANLQDEVLELKKLGESIETGGEFDLKRISPFIEEVPETLVLNGDKPNAENMKQVVKGLAILREEVLTFKSEALKAIDDCMTIKHLGSAEAADENMVRLASGEDGRIVQSGVYAATFFRSFGYNDPELEFDLMLAVLLAEIPKEKVAQAFPGRVAALHGFDEADGGEMLLRDFGQALRLARSYLKATGNTSKLAIDQKIFHELCADQNAATLDKELLERARQGAQVEMLAAERVRLADMAEAAQIEVSKLV